VSPKLPTLYLLTLLCVSCSPSADPSQASAPSADQSDSAPSAQRDPLIHLHVPSKSAEGAARFKADWSYDLVVHEGWSVHVHVIPPGQLVPPHHHPENDELSWVASGRGEWSSWTAGQPPKTSEIGVGAVVVAPRGAVHSVRNPGPEDLSVVVIHRPSFGQNWYVMPEDVSSSSSSGPLAANEAFPEGFFEGWQLDRSGQETPAAHPADSLYLVGGGSGTLRFKDNILALKPGHFAAVPPGLLHEIAITEGAGEQLELLVVRIPR